MTSQKQPSLVDALIPVVALISMLAAAVYFFSSEIGRAHV